MALFTIDIPDALVQEAQDAHARAQNRLPLEQRSQLVVDAAYARLTVVAGLRGIILQDLVEGGRLQLDTDVRAVHDRINVYLKPVAPP